MVNRTFKFLPIKLLYLPDCGEEWEMGFAGHMELEVNGQRPGEAKQPRDRHKIHRGHT